MDNLTINLGPIVDFLNLPPDQMGRLFLFYFGWIPIAFAFIFGSFKLWMYYINGQFAGKQKRIFLAIDIPRGNEQSPKAVENLFSYVAGAHGSINLIEKYWDGKFQLSISFEIVSIDGYTQFVIATPDSFRDLLETAIYSQYPDAEITEIDDYTRDIPTSFPDEEYDIWGSDFVLVDHDFLPIKTYIDFEHQNTPLGEQYKDTMAVLMDLCSSLRPGEQLWSQLIVTPIDTAWVKAGDDKIAEMTGQAKSKPDLFERTFVWLFSLLIPDYQPPKESKEEFSMFKLTPKKKNQIDGVTRKISKLGFKCKMRTIYVAKKDVMNKPKAVNGFVGYMKQFGSMELNSIKPDTALTATSVSYLFKDSRLNEKKYNVMKNYKSRDGGAGSKQCYLNVEELATLWHFPVETVVKAPLIQKAPGRKAEPPMTLPLGENIAAAEEIDDLFAADKRSKKKSEPGKAMTPAEEEDIFADKPAKQGVSETGRNSPPDNLPFI